MYVRDGLSLPHLVMGSRRLFAVAAILSLSVHLVHDLLGFEALEIPALPVATLGIVVSLYLGFVSASAYARWWEARTALGEIVNLSRSWANACLSLIDSDVDASSHSPEDVRHLLKRHLAWINCLCFQLRPPTAHGPARETDPAAASVPGSRESYLSFLGREDAAFLIGKINPAVHILRLQGDALRQMRLDGRLDRYQFVELVRLLSSLYDGQGKCERIKNTPFPTQFVYFGRIFTWTLIFLLPFAFVDAFIRLADNYPGLSAVAQDYIYALIPFNILISWVFFLLLTVSESCLEPFDGKPSDVPIAALTRVIERDLLQMMGEDSLPDPCKPVDGVLQ